MQKKLQHFLLILVIFIMPLSFVRSQRGKPILTHRGYSYKKHHERESGAEVWYCRMRGCKSQIVTEDDAVIEDPGDHPHAPNPAETVVIKARSQDSLTNSTLKILVDFT